MIGSSAMVIPLKSFIWSGWWPGLFFWPSVLLVLGIPVVAFMIFLIRKLSGARRMHAAVGYTLAFLWLLGLVMLAYMARDVGQHFRMKSISKVTIDFHQPSVRTLYVKLQPVLGAHEMTGRRNFTIIGNWISLRDDSLFYPNVRVHIIPSPQDDSFRIEVNKSAFGATMDEARENADRLSIPFVQDDSVLYFPDAVPLPMGVLSGTSK